MTLKQYMPDYYRDIYDMNLILDTEEYLFYLLGTSFQEFSDNQYILTSNLQRIMVYESILNIVPNENDTLDIRRQRVQREWNNNNPYSLRFLLNTIAMIQGNRNLNGTYEDLYRLHLVVSLDKEGQVKTVEDIIDQLVPLNMVVEVSNRLYGHATAFYRHGSGAVITQFFTLTHDFKTNAESNAQLKHGSVSVNTAKQILTQDFEKVLDAVGAINKGSSSSIASVIEIKEE